jgi:hypothetical protein
MNESQKDEAYEKVLEKIKQVYKPKLKGMTKNQLINLVVEMSAQTAALKTQRDIDAQEAQEAQGAK